jgi:large subunit ribosomal protein L22
MAQDKKTIKEVKAFARYVHVSPQKLRLVADLVRSTPVDVALEQLKFSSKDAALPLLKVINSAIANATHNFDIKRETLYIKTVTVDGGPVFRRYAPRAQGRAFIQRKRTSHISLILGTRAGQTARKRTVFQAPTKAAAPHKHDHDHADHDHDEDTSAKQNVKQGPKSDEKLKQNKVTQKRRMFNRKTGQ